MRFKQRIKGWHVKERHITAGHNNSAIKVGWQRLKSAFDGAAGARDFVLVGNSGVREEGFDVVGDALALVANYRDDVCGAQ